MNIGKQIKMLCSPAKVYFLLSTLTILGILSQNSLRSKKYVVGHHEVDIPHMNIWFFVCKFLIVIVWTYILQELCKNGYKNISWFLVLMPYFFMFLAIGALIVVFSKVSN